MSCRARSTAAATAEVEITGSAGGERPIRTSGPRRRAGEDGRYVLLDDFVDTAVELVRQRAAGGPVP